MAHNVKKAIIAWGDDTRCIEADVPVYYYGFSNKDDVYADNLEISEKGTKFDVYFKVNILILSFHHNLAIIIY